MKRAAPILAALAAILTAAAAPVRTATENFVTNKIAEAEARTAAAITAATNAIPRPDLTPATNYVDALKGDLEAGGITVYSAHAAQEATLAQNANYAAYADTSSKTLALDDGNDGVRDTISVLYALDNAATKSELIAATNAIPRSAGVDAEAVTNIVRDISLGGIWDEDLQVWWTPVMRNGSLTYQATTNVNLNAED